MKRVVVGVWVELLNSLGPGPVSIGRAARVLGVDVAEAERLLEEMVKLGFAERLLPGLYRVKSEDEVLEETEG